MNPRKTHKNSATPMIRSDASNIKYQHLGYVSVAGSIAFALLLLGCYLNFDSQLALAQAADSMVDVLATGVLIWTLHIGAQPRDKNHPFGHRRAEPLGALVTAATTAALSIEVFQRALEALLAERSPTLDLSLPAAFLAKAAFKVVVLVIGRRIEDKRSPPALKALLIDAKNDVLVSLLAVVAYGIAHFGLPAFDAALALPLAVWIGWTGFRLGVENVDLLMGAAPQASRQEELQALAEREPGVIAVQDFRAQHVGQGIWVELCVAVAAEASVGDGERIAQRIEHRLATEPDVDHAFVRVKASRHSKSS